jgi:hypothetical protein
MQKLHLALDIYRGLGLIPATRADTLAKVTSMLLHPFPKVCLLVERDVYVLIVEQVRMQAAETLWFLTHEHDWSLPSKSLKPAVDGIRATLTAMVTS